MAFVKLDTNIRDSSLFVVGGYELGGFFLRLAAMADANGVVHASAPSLVLPGTPMERVCEMLKELSEPDPYSRTPDGEGRRIEIRRKPEYAIQILNYERNRAKDHTGAARQRRFRERHRNGATVTGDAPLRNQKQKQKQKQKQSSREPTVPHTPPSIDELAKSFIHNFNWCTGRHCQVTSEVLKKVKAALKGGTKPDEILCFPFIHQELNSRRKERRTLHPDWLLRDGTRNTHNWIAEALHSADGLELGTRLSNVAAAMHMVEKLRALGVKGSPTEVLDGGD
jgi:hypothetical protein